MKTQRFVPVLIVNFIIINAVCGAAVDYYHICHENEPNLAACVKITLQNVLAKLHQGIPELKIGPLEPLHFDKLQVVSENGLTTNISNVYMHGLSKTEIVDVTAKLSKRSFQDRVKLRIPKLIVEGNYEMDTKILFLRLKGKGFIQVNATDVLMELVSKADKVPRGGKEYLQFGNITGTAEFPTAKVYIDGLFKDPQIDRAINDVINDNANVLFDEVKPSLLKVVFEVLRDIANKATERFPVSELFPK